MMATCVIMSLHQGVLQPDGSFRELVECRNLVRVNQLVTIRRTDQDMTSPGFGVDSSTVPGGTLGSNRCSRLARDDQQVNVRRPLDLGCGVVPHLITEAIEQMPTTWTAFLPSRR